MECSAIMIVLDPIIFSKILYVNADFIKNQIIMMIGQLVVVVTQQMDSRSALTSRVGGSRPVGEGCVTLSQ